MAAAVGGLDAETQATVKGVVLYGYTKNLQNGGEIPSKFLLNREGSWKGTDVIGRLPSRSDESLL